MANRKAGSGDGGTGGAKRSAAGKKGAGAATGDAAQAPTGEETASAKKRSPRSASAAGGDTNTAESQPSKSAKRGAAKIEGGGGAGGAGGAGDGESGGGQGAAKKGAAKGAAKGGGRGAAKQAGGGGGSADLQSDLRQFVSDNPNGWDHSQWEGLLSRLGQRGHDTSNAGQIGMQLERERLTSRLQGVEGVSPQKARSIVERYGALYNLRGADVEEIAREAKVSRDVAERIKRQLG